MNAVVATPDSAARPALRIALVLGGVAALTVALVIPYAIALLPAAQRAVLPSLSILIPLQVLQAFVLFVFMAWAGLRLGERNRLDAPVLRRLLHGAGSLPDVRAGLEVVLGALLAVAGVALVTAWLDPMLPAFRNGTPPSPTALQGFMASFYGGIAEELQTRLFLMTLTAWLLVRAGIARSAALALAALVAALLFGAGHLPAAAGVWPLDGVVVARTVLANAVPGLVFGALFARHGIECAIAAHFLADLGLHVVPPLLSG